VRDVWRVVDGAVAVERRERRVVSVVMADLEGYGHRVTYTVHRERPLRRPDLAGTTVGDLIDLIQTTTRAADADPDPA
jgi:hypothetical protein